MSETDETRLRKGRFVKKSGESTLDSDVEAAKVKTLDSFAETKKRINRAIKKGEEFIKEIEELKANHGH